MIRANFPVLVASHVTLIPASEDAQPIIANAVPIEGRFEYPLPKLPKGQYDIFLTVPGVVSKQIDSIRVESDRKQEFSFSGESQSLLAPQKITASILVDAAAISDKESAAVMTLLKSELPASSWSPYIVQPGDNISKIVEKLYRFPDEGYGRTASVIATAIEAEHGTDLVRPGDAVLVPPFPQRPDPAKIIAGAEQHVSLAQGTIEMRGAGDVKLGSGFGFGGAGLPLKAAREWHIDGATASILAAANGSTSTSHKRSVYIDYGTQDVEVSFADIPKLGLHGPQNLQELILPKGTTLPRLGAPRGRLYIIDDFKSRSNECAHGEMVYSVVMETLKALGTADALKDSVEKVNLDFYADVNKSRTIITEYAHTFTHSGESQALADLERLVKRGKKKSPVLSVPALYLAALIDHYSHQENAIISTSFVTYGDGLKWLPEDYSDASTTVFVAAVLDTEHSIAENSLYAHTEPIESFLKSPSLGVILVGGELTPGVPLGMISNSAKVTCVGYAAGWNQGQGCFASDGAVGTSFSTPYIATLLHVAESYWGTNSLAVNAIESKTRLLLASDLVPDYLTYYASAGRPRVDRLLTMKGTYLIAQDGHLVEQGIKSSKITVRDANGEFSTTLRRGSSGISGLQIVDGKAFIFREAVMHWERVELEELSLSFVGIPGEMSIQQFSKLYRGVLIV